VTENQNTQILKRIW